MQTATSEAQSKSRGLSISVHHCTLGAPCPKGQGIVTADISSCEKHTFSNCKIAFRQILRGPFESEAPWMRLNVAEEALAGPRARGASRPTGTCNVFSPPSAESGPPCCPAQIYPPVPVP